MDEVERSVLPNAGKLSPEDRKRLTAAVAALKKAADEHQVWLDDTLVPNAKGDFRIGQQLYDEKLKFALMSSLSRAEITQRALHGCAVVGLGQAALGAGDGEGEQHLARVGGHAAFDADHSAGLAGAGVDPGEHLHVEAAEPCAAQGDGR